MLQRLPQALFSNIIKRCNAIHHTRNVSHSSSNISEDDKEEMAGMFSQIHSRKLDKVATRKAALPFDKLASIETPSLLLNMDELQANLNAMNDWMDSNDALLRIRPNTNIHKSAQITQIQHKVHQNRMDGICCSTVNEAELLINSAANFLAPSSAHRIHDVFLSNICIDLSKMWRFVQLYDTAVLDMRLSALMDDVFQVHLWNYTME
eukprot:361397_1